MALRVGDPLRPHCTWWEAVWASVLPNSFHGLPRLACPPQPSLYVCIMCVCNWACDSNPALFPAAG